MKKLILSTFAVLMIAAPAAYACHHDGGNYKNNRDTNGDGVISKEEFVSHAEKQFMKMDANNDGTVTKDEQHAAKKKMRQEMKNKKNKWKQKKMNKDASANSISYNN